MTVAVTRILRETGEDFTGGRVGWSHMTSLTVTICTPRLFSIGGLFSRTTLLSTVDGKYPRNESEWNIRVMVCIYENSQAFRSQVVSFIDGNRRYNGYVYSQVTSIRLLHPHFKTK